MTYHLRSGLSVFAARGAAGYALAGSDSAGSRAAQARASNPEQPADQVGPSPVGQANPKSAYDKLRPSRSRTPSLATLRVTEMVRPAGG